MIRRATSGDTRSREADLLSYLLFDASYARVAAELGYQDARLREEELARFFSDER